MARAEYEKRVQSLVGKQVLGVVYHEIDYGDGEFHFFADGQFDSLALGFELTLDSGEPATISWGNEFVSYGISLTYEKKPAALSTSRLLEASSSSRWRTVIGKSIEGAEVYWSWCEEGGKPETRVHYPQDLHLRFSGNLNVVISALEICESGKCMGMMDHLTIFYDLDVAKQYKCLGSV